MKTNQTVEKEISIPSATIPSPLLSPTPILALDLSSLSTNVHEIRQFAEILADLEKDAILKDLHTEILKQLQTWRQHQI